MSRFSPLSNLSPEIRQELEDMLDVGLYNEAVETVGPWDSGALSVEAKASIITVSGTKAYTLADGEWEGQQKTLFCDEDLDSADGTVTPASPAAGYSTITLDNTGESVLLEWHESEGWVVVGVNGATINA